MTGGAAVAWQTRVYQVSMALGEHELHCLLFLIQLLPSDTKLTASLEHLLTTALLASLCLPAQPLSHEICA